MRRRCCLILAACLPAIAAASLSGCSPAEAQSSSKAPAAVREVPVTVAPLERRTVERTIDVVGTLRGWEQVTIGSKRTGRVSKVLHDMGDHVRPGEPLVELEAVDAKLAYDQAQSKYLGELVKLGITEQQAQRFIEQYGISEELIRGKQAEEAIDRVPAVIQVLVSKEKALHNLNRQRALSKKGASTVQELEDYENEYRSASAAYENARATARNVIASAVANRVARNQAIQTLADMIIRVPKPELTPPGSSQADAVVYAVTKRSVSEGQMVREGEAVCELIIENPLRLWTSAPERYAEQVRVGQPVRITVSSQPDLLFLGKVVRINPSVDAVSRTFQVETQVPNDRRLLRAGGFAKATIITDSAAQAAVAPTESIIRFAGVTKLFFVENGKARSVNDIVTGSEGPGWVEVTSKSLPTSAMVVITGQTQLANGTPVVIRTPGPPSDHHTKPETAPIATVSGSKAAESATR
ncbi:MAG: efflux RND transporter periplasmic adaptor subunit [Isosphaeraceae bacterium]|jgi:membrane fusion protein (multidrug efflux system)